MHEIFQRTGRTPDEVMDKPDGVRDFLFKSMQVKIEQEIKEAEAIRSKHKS